MENLLRIGKISSINYENGTARVTYEDKRGSTTAEFSFLAWEYWMPNIGDQVLVAHVSTGTSSAVILGQVWHDGNRPEINGEGIYRKEYARQQQVAGETYDENTDTFTVTAGQCTFEMAAPGEMTSTAPESYTITAGDCTLTMSGGTLTISAPSGITITGSGITFNGQQVHP